MIDSRTAPYAALVLRVTLGALFLAHAGLKLFVFTPAGTAKFFGSLGFPPELVYGRVLPAAAISILVGNVAYAIQARRLAERTGRHDVCALPYGINTVSLFAHVFLVMLPAKTLAIAAGAADPARIAWQAGLFATLSSGVIELVCAPIAERLRKATPRAALLSTLAGIALSFISLGFLYRTFARPLIGLTTLAIVMLTYFGRVRFKGRLPGGVLAVSLGTLLAWLTGIAPVGARPSAVQEACSNSCEASTNQCYQQIYGPNSAAQSIPPATEASTSPLMPEPPMPSTAMLRISAAGGRSSRRHTFPASSCADASCSGSPSTASRNPSESVTGRAYASKVGRMPSASALARRRSCSASDTPRSTGSWSPTSSPQTCTSDRRQAASHL